LRRVTPPLRDPRLRPYRVALWILYFAVVLVGIGLMATSIGRTLHGASRPSGHAQGPLPTRAALRVCLTDLELLYREQNQHAWALGAGFEGRDPIGAWHVWARAWEQRVADLSDRCRLDAGGGEDAAARSELAAARDALRALHRAYTAQVNRFAQEQSDLANAAAEALAHAREEVGRAR
jgi:hypothetical protein